MYCIYTNRLVPQDKGNWDHIIPLSLGGSNRFCIWSDADFNSRMGSRVDGAMANDFLVQMLRQRSDARGHSNRPVEPVWRNSTMGDRPVQVKFPADPKQPIQVWDAKARTNIDETDLAGRPLTSKHHISIDENLRFLAKVCLGAGYFLLQDEFPMGIDCDELRALIAFDRTDEKTHPALKSSKLIIAHRFDPTLKNSNDGKMYKAACRRTPGTSLVIMQKHDGYLSFHVGILGEFMGSVFCQSTRSLWPTSIEDQGKVIELTNKSQVLQHTVFEWFKTWHDEIEKKKTEV